MTTGLLAAWSGEWLKARRSRVPAVTFGVFAIAAAVEAAFMFIATDPDRARALGLLNQKAQLLGLEADWTGLLTFNAQVIAVGALLLFSFIATWVFGQEFTQGTAPYLMAQPVSRAQVVVAKFALIGAWCAALTAWMVALSMCVGWLMHLPGWSAGVVLTGAGNALLAGALMIPAIGPIALVASMSRGYLAPLAASLGFMVLAQVAGFLGWGAVVPWAVPAILAGLVPGQVMSAGSALIVLATGTVAIVGTTSWWRSADAGL